MTHTFCQQKNPRHIIANLLLLAIPVVLALPGWQQSGWSQPQPPRVHKVHMHDAATVPALRPLHLLIK